MSRVNLKDILKDVLKDNEIHSAYYSLNGYKEGAVCMEKNEKGYSVFEAEKAVRYNEKIWSKQVEAIYDVIVRVAENYEEEKEMKSEFAERVLRELYM